MKALNKQAGLTMWGWMCIIVLIGFAGLQGLKLFNPVMDYYTLDSVAKKTQEDYNSGKLDRELIRDRIEKASYMNAIKDFKVTPKTVKIEEGKNEALMLKIFHEQRIDYFWDIDFVVTYNKEYELKR